MTGDRTLPLGCRGRLLVVDDDRDFAESLSILLEFEQYHVLTAHDGAAALAQSDGIEVALIDVRLGHEDGVQVAADMHRLNPSLLIIMITAYASVQTAIRALQAGAYDYLCKPFETADLLATIARCFDRLHLVRTREIAEERLRNSQRMEAVGRLATGIAHDFNNLLSVIVGNLRLVQEDFRHGRDANKTEASELIDDTLEAALEGIDVTRRLLAVGRAQVLAPQSIDIRHAIEGMARMLRRLFGEQVALQLILPETPCLAHIDAQAFETSILNLAINARDAIAGNGRVRIAVTVAAIPASSPIPMVDPRVDSYVSVEIADDGCGMTAEVREQALQPFFTTKPPEKGSGLGLSTVYGFVRQSGGDLTIESTPEKGSIITIFLPSQSQGRLQLSS